jgi:Glycosyl hydrolase family 63 C-terminal domain
MALELASEDSAYEDVASKFFEHFVAINDAMNSMGEAGLWDEQDGFYYDELHVNGRCIPLRIRSGVGIIPLFACEMLSEHVMRRLPGFAKRTNWFLQNRPELARHISTTTKLGEATVTQRLLSIAPRDYLVRVLRYVLDEREFLSPFGIRSMSRVHVEHPFIFRSNGDEYRVDYEPSESRSGLFGGNSNWRGPVWLPINYLLIEALERYHHFYGDDLRVEYPTGSGNHATLLEVSRDLSRRIASLFLPDDRGRRPVHGDDPRWASNPNWRDHVLFYEYFDGDTGRGLGASHQTGWTALVVRLVEDIARERGAKSRRRENLNQTPASPVHG